MSSLPVIRFRVAEDNDFQHVVDLMERFYPKVAHCYPGIPFDRDSAENTFFKLMDEGLVLVGDNSAAGFLIVESPFNESKKIAYLIFWCVESPSEMAIFDVVRDWARRFGATHFNAASHAPDHTVGRWYGKRGLKESEIQYIEELVETDQTDLKGVE